MSPLRSDTVARQWWDLLVVLTTVGVVVETPLRVTLDLLTGAWMWPYDLVVTAILTLDVLLNLVSRAPDRKSPAANLGQIARDYLKGWFALDLAAAVPFDMFLVALAPSGDSGMLHLLCLARLARLPRLVQYLRWRARESNLNPSLFRLGSLVFWILVGAHFIACAWLLLGAGNSAGTSADYAPDDAVRRYVRALYWTTTTLTTIGYGDIAPVDNVQTVFCMFVQLLGAGMYGLVIGAMASLIANIDVAKAQFRERMEKIETFMKYKSLPQETRERVHDYYQYLWETRRGYDEYSLVEEFPGPLKAEILLFLNRAMIEKVPFFRGARPDFVREIVLLLRPVVFSPGEFVFRKGEVGHDMYFISRGAVEVVSEDGQTVFATLREGNFFGEIALLLSQPRTASIRALEFTDLYQLDQEAVERALKRFPDFEKQIRELAERRHQEITRTVSGP
ncbi:MAG: cyclic nucleotide-binding domain-containing protein [Planctomycetes bacterium]|nr:cyclic nucleotide-binding domain-containing protein [Planctomycetota bacterium]